MKNTLAVIALLIAMYHGVMFYASDFISRYEALTRDRVRTLHLADRPYKSERCSNSSSSSWGGSSLGTLLPPSDTGSAPCQ